MINHGPRITRAPRRTRLIALLTLTVLTATGFGAEAVARASLTGKIEDAARSVTVNGDEALANSWSGWQVRLSLTDGTEMDRRFTK